LRIKARESNFQVFLRYDHRRAATSGTSERINVDRRSCRFGI
jgi:hypothetical protein